MFSWLYKLASPKIFYTLSGVLLPWVAVLTVGFLVYGIIGALVLAPPDYQQSETVRILYVHVPSAYMAIKIYLIMAFAAILSLVWKIKLADIVVKVSAPIGAWFTFLTLLTGSLWAKPMWGTWWIWDARVTTVFILLFIYLGIIALRRAIPESQASAKAANILTVVGVVNLPIIHFSVYWWKTLHQMPTFGKFGKPSIDFSMFWPFLVMMVAFMLFYLCILLWRARWELVKREANSQWVKEMVIANE